MLKKQPALAQLIALGQSDQKIVCPTTPNLPPDFHPAVHFDQAGQWASFGFRHTVNEANGLALIRRRQGALPEIVGLDERGPSFRPTYELWFRDDVSAFVLAGDAPTFHQLLSAIREVLLHYVKFRHEEEAALVACWVVGTYFHPLFTTFPRLNITGIYQSGKSKLLSMIAAMSRDGELLITPTHASLFRDADARWYTACLDEMEKLSHEDHRQIRAFLNTGYKAGARVPRMEGSAEKGWVTKYYKAYVPVAVASIEGADLVLADRSVTITLERALSRKIKRREVDLRDPTFGRIRAMAYRAALTNWPLVVRGLKVVEDMVDADLLDLLAGRPLELFRPLLAIGDLGDKGILDAVFHTAQRHCAGQETISERELALLQEVGRRLGGKDNIVVYPGELAIELYPDDDPQTKSASVGHLLKKFFDAGNRTKRGIPYPISRARFQEHVERFGIADLV